MKTRPLSPEALAALATAIFDGATVRIPGKLDRALYVEVNKALEALGGKWNRKLAGHVFSGIPKTARALIEDVLAASGYVDKKKDLQQFFTPAAVADLLVKLADLKPAHSVLEPSAGRGAIVAAIARAQPRVHLSCIEIDRDNFKALQTTYPAASGGFAADEVINDDFLTVKPGDDLPLYQRIIMNPPFAKHADVEHVLHAWKFLAPGGRLVAVMSAHVTFADDSVCREFRDFARKHAPDTIEYLARPCGDGGFFPLLDNAFAESGTGVRTVVVVLEKP